MPNGYLIAVKKLNKTYSRRGKIFLFLGYPNYMAVQVSRYMEHEDRRGLIRALCRRRIV